MAIFRPKSSAPAKRVWRISQSAPKGEWVDRLAPATPKPGENVPEVSYGSWVTSSYDLFAGADVIEDPDTLPDDLFDEMFAPKPDSPAGSGE